MPTSKPHVETKQRIVAKLARVDPVGAAIGILLSLLLHSILIAWAWNRTLPAANRPEPQNQVALEVRLVPIPLATPALELKPRQVPQSETVRATRAPKPAVLKTVQASDAPVVVRETPVAAVQVLPEKHIDVESVRSGLAAIVAEVDREKRDTPVGQLIAKPLYPLEANNKMAHAIDGSIRQDCRDRIANTGLLAPLFILGMALDRKNSGCKW